MWQRLGWIEWQRSLILGKPNRDFFWLTALLFLTLLLACLLWGSQQGLLNKFVDVSVGYIENAGIPIWVATNPPKTIKRETLQNSSFKLYPYREVERMDVALLDDKAIWDEKNREEDKKAPFMGWAVLFDDPLWKMSKKHQEEVGETSLPLTIILNQSLFRKYFNCDAYVSKLQSLLPFLKKPVKQENDPLYCLSNEDGKEELWLDVRVGADRELLPFHVEWQLHIPTMQDLAFLFPLSTLNTLKVARNYTELEYYPLIQLNPQMTRVKEVSWLYGENTTIEPVKSCFPEWVENSDGSRITFRKPIAKEWVIRCAKYHNLTLQMTPEELMSGAFLQITEEVPNRYSFQYDTAGNILTVSCQQPNCKVCQKENLLREALGISSDKAISCAGDQLQIDAITATGGYSYAFAYVESRQQLVGKVAEITNFPSGQPNKAFYIPSTYEDALVRFMFVEKVMSILEKFYSPIFVIFLVVLLLIQIGIVITHRKRNYGIYLSKGIFWYEVRNMVLLQVTLSFLLAVVLTLVAGEVMQQVLVWQIDSVTTRPPFVDHIVASHLDLLPLAWMDYLIVGGGIFLILCSTTLILLWRMVWSKYREPAYLLY